MSSEDVKVLLEDLISGYRAYHIDTSFREVQSTAEREVVKSKAERSAAALNSLFGACTGYSEELLLKESPGASDEILKELERMVEQVQEKRPGGLKTSTFSGSADTADDLTCQLDVFIRTRTDDESPVFWPFVGIIRVYLRSLFLRTGIVLADLPG
jgi:hypothetical protein